MRWRKVTLIGVGLLGGSLGLALRKRGLAGQVQGYVRRPGSIEECVRAGAVDIATCDLQEAVKNVDLVVLCTPLAQMGDLARSFLEQLEPGVLITDVGSVKGPLVRELEPMFLRRGAFFVGSHPMAGSEKMGVAAARADLFQNAVCVVTPTPNVRPEHAELIEGLWKSVGARVLRLSPEAHDELVARSSHLPHVLAAHLVSGVLAPERAPEQSQLCANGFRDSTRIASGSPEMWRDIVIMNKGPVQGAIREFASRLEEFNLLLERNDPATLQAFFESAKKLRDGWTAKCASNSPE